MKLHLIYFTNDGEILGNRLKTAVKFHEITLFRGFGTEKTPLRTFCEEGFHHADGLIFISATGIAVRGIAPFVASKMTDPAVLVLDESGNFVISLLSGHFGQANQLTQELSHILCNIPVITTATDQKNIFAVDSYAKKMGYHLLHPEGIKVFSGRLLRGEIVKVYSPFFPVILEKNMELTTSMEECHLAIGNHSCEKLTLIPPSYSLGIGCKRDTNPEKLKDFITNQLNILQISTLEIQSMGSIDLKAEEPAILTLSEKWKLPFHTFSAKTLQNISGDFTTSNFVLETVGTDNVCERSAIACGGEVLVLRKISLDGMTLAIAKKEIIISFQEET